MKIALLMLLLLAPLQVRADEAADVVALKALETARHAAIMAQDFETLHRIYAEDFVAIAVDGTVLSRSDLMDVFRRTDQTLTFTADEIDVRVYGDTAILIGRLTARTGSGEIVSAGRFTHVFVKRSGSWVCVHGQSTRIASQKVRPDRG